MVASFQEKANGQWVRTPWKRKGHGKFQFNSGPMSVFKGTEWEHVSERISDAEQAVFSQVSRGRERTLSLGNRMGKKKRKQAPTWFLWHSTGLFLGTRPGTSPHVELIGEPACGVATWKTPRFSFTVTTFHIHSTPDTGCVDFPHQAILSLSAWG